jgi:hypothetical protein
MKAWRSEMRKMIIVGMTAATLAVPAATLVAPAAASASSDNQVTSPVGGPGCFGHWRAGSMQALKDGTLVGYTQYKNGGALISYRASDLGDQAAQNAADHATCDALS